MFPLLTIDLKKVEQNTRVVVDACIQQGIEVIGVTKGCLGNPDIARAMLKGGVAGFADSRVRNLQKLRTLNAPCLMLLRQPMVEERSEVVEVADVSFVTEYAAALNLSEAALALGRTHRVILMVETGDLREGVPLTELEKAVGKIIKLKGLKLEGLATNIACFEETSSASESLEFLAAVVQGIREKFALDLTVVSGGNSSAWKAVESAEIPPEINQLRIGEAILLGQETTSFETLPGACQNAFLLSAEVLEIAEKTLNKNLKGLSRKQAVVALGKQDIGGGQLKPLLKGAEILRLSSDHLVIDLSRVSEDLEVGEKVTFVPDYFALLGAMTSPYVYKNFSTNLKNIGKI